MSQEGQQHSENVLTNLGTVLPDLESLYKDIHSHPELSMQEKRTAGIAAEHLRSTGFDVTTGIGKTGVVGVLKNGDGPTIMLRADMDALPVLEATGLPYASKVTSTDRDGKTVPVMHACGHDMHVTWLIGAATWFAQHRNGWRGTLMPLFQPAEETGEGAGAIRLQTIVSREVAPTDAAVVTVGSLQAGTKENVIPDEAIIKLNVRTFDEDVRRRVLAAIERIVNAEAEASRAPKKPEITPLDRYAFVKNDPDATKRVADAFRSYFPAERVQQTQPTTASEDFGSFGTGWHVPSVFWFVGGTDPDLYAKAKKAGTVANIPTNHNPRFAPVIHPTLEAGVEALVVASQAWVTA